MRQSCLLNVGHIATRSVDVANPLDKAHTYIVKQCAMPTDHKSRPRDAAVRFAVCVYPADWRRQSLACALLVCVLLIDMPLICRRFAICYPFCHSGLGVTCVHTSHQPHEQPKRHVQVTDCEP